jgi:NAD(P)-dependent dehydrogenase (short-subunit alcohol dehydrogenase family)
MDQFKDGFTDKVAIVTGGASGIGLATSARLREEGASVVIADLDEARGKDCAEEIGAEFIRLDVSDPDAWRDAVSGIVSRHGGLDLAYLNAGVTTYPASGEELIAGFEIADLPDENYRRIMGANVDGVIFGARAVVPALEARGGGAIVATASAAGVIAFPPDPIYTMTKHAVIGFVRSLAPALAHKQISLNAILPGAVDTNILGDGFADKAREMGIPMIDPSQIAAGVVHAVTQGSTGKLWLCLAGQDPQAYEFAPVAGLGIPADVEG